jgi:hypothetical protein
MSLEDVKLAKNDSLPSLEYTLSRKGSGSTTPNLSGFTANLKVRQQGATTNSFSISVTSGSTANGQITDPESGVVRFDFSTGRFGSSGTFIGELSFLSSGGKTETAPDSQSFIVRGEF